MKFAAQISPPLNSKLFIILLSENEKSIFLFAGGALKKTVRQTN